MRDRRGDGCLTGVLVRAHRTAAWFGKVANIAAEKPQELSELQLRLSERQMAAVNLLRQGAQLGVVQDEETFRCFVKLSFELFALAWSSEPPRLVGLDQITDVGVVATTGEYRSWRSVRPHLPSEGLAALRKLVEASSMDEANRTTLGPGPGGPLGPGLGAGKRFSLNTSRHRFSKSAGAKRANMGGAHAAQATHASAAAGGQKSRKRAMSTDALPIRTSSGQLVSSVSFGAPVGGLGAQGGGSGSGGSGDPGRGSAGSLTKTPQVTVAHIQVTDSPPPAARSNAKVSLALDDAPAASKASKESTADKERLPPPPGARTLTRGMTSSSLTTTSASFLAASSDDTPKSKSLTKSLSVHIDSNKALPPVGVFPPPRGAGTPARTAMPRKRWLIMSSMSTLISSVNGTSAGGGADGSDLHRQQTRSLSLISKERSSKSRASRLSEGAAKEVFFGSGLVEDSMKQRSRSRSHHGRDERKFVHRRLYVTVAPSSAHPEPQRIIFDLPDYTMLHSWLIGIEALISFYVDVLYCRIARPSMMPWLRAVFTSAIEIERRKSGARRAWPISISIGARNLPMVLSAANYALSRESSALLLHGLRERGSQKDSSHRGGDAGGSDGGGAAAAVSVGMLAMAQLLGSKVSFFEFQQVRPVCMHMYMSTCIVHSCNG